VTTNAYTSGSSRPSHWRGLWQYRELLKNLVVRDIKVRYKRSVLGFAWMMINPLVMMVVLWVVFNELFGSETNYALYLISGLLFFNFFALGSSQGLASVVNAGSLIRKVAVPKAIFPLASVLANLVNFAFSLVPLVVVLFVLRLEITPSALVLPIPILACFLFTFGVSLLLSTLNVFYRDVRWFYDSALQVLQWATPIVYPLSIIPEKYRGLFAYNPLARLVDAFRAPIMQGPTTTVWELAFVLGLGVVTAVVGWIVFHKYEEKFINYL
jgi:ABC-type polysaccharide/polyol phosphate export permease